MTPISPPTSTLLILGLQSARPQADRGQSGGRRGQCQPPQTDAGLDAGRVARRGMGACHRTRGQYLRRGGQFAEHPGSSGRREHCPEHAGSRGRLDELGFCRDANETSYDAHFTTPAGHQGITFIASSGDNGSLAGASYPAASPNVLSVGGTTLLLSSTGAYQSESAWIDSGGGYSQYEPEPSLSGESSVHRLTGPRPTSPSMATRTRASGLRDRNQPLR